MKSLLPPHRDTQNGLGVAPQRAQQEASLGVPYADAAVVGARQQQAGGALQRRAQAADASWGVALKHPQLFQSLTGGTGSVNDSSRGWQTVFDHTPLS